MTSRRFKPTEPTALEEFGRDLAERRSALAGVELPRNGGTRRTPGKRALLKAIEDAGGKW